MCVVLMYGWVVLAGLVGQYPFQEIPIAIALVVPLPFLVVAIRRLNHLFVVTTVAVAALSIACMWPWPGALLASIIVNLVLLWCIHEILARCGGTASLLEASVAHFMMGILWLLCGPSQGGHVKQTEIEIAMAAVFNVGGLTALLVSGASIFWTGVVSRNKPRQST